MCCNPLPNSDSIEKAMTTALRLSTISYNCNTEIVLVHPSQTNKLIRQYAIQHDFIIKDFTLPSEEPIITYRCEDPKCSMLQDSFLTSPGSSSLLHSTSKLPLPPLPPARNFPARWNLVTTSDMKQSWHLCDEGGESKCVSKLEVAIGESLREVAKYASALVVIWNGKNTVVQTMINEMQQLNKNTYIHLVSTLT